MLILGGTYVLLTCCLMTARADKLLEISASDVQDMLETTTYKYEISYPSDSCRLASLKCLHRSGCGSTLQSYQWECDDLLKNRTSTCSERCKNTLVGLTSTEEGKQLMECSCSDPDCIHAKKRLESCRSSVLHATASDTVVTCSEARWICLSDAECAKAIEYYQIFCRAMFRGNRCTERCKNSLAILRRQRQARKLEDCVCGVDEYMDEWKCTDIKRYTQELCIGIPEDKTDPEAEPDQDEHSHQDSNDLYAGETETGPKSPTSRASASGGAEIVITLAVIITHIVSLFIFQDKHKVF